MFAKGFLTAGVFGLAALSLVNAAPMTSDEVQALDIINHARRAVSQPDIAWDNTLKGAAQVWSGNLAVYGKLEHAPTSERQGAGELLSMFRSENRNDAQMTHPIRESVKNWLNTDFNKQAAKGSQELHIAEQLISSKATHIGCASSGINGKAPTQWFLYTVCRVHADIKLVEDSISRRQDMSKGPFTGEITYYNPALGSCGEQNGDGDDVVALSHIKMGSQSNGNSLCGQMIEISIEGKTATAKVVDKCMSCAVGDIDVSPKVFQSLFGDLGRGRVGGVSWRIL